MLSNLVIFQDLFIKSGFCLIFAFFVNFYSTKKYIEFINKKNLFQPIRKDGPQTHKAKKKTPTMGGIFIILSTILSTLIFCDLSNIYIWLILGIFLSFALIGLYDDLIKVLQKNTNGFKGSKKLILQFMIVAIIYLILATTQDYHLKGQIYLPISDGFLITLGAGLYFIFVAIVIVGSSNSVNLTDGLDGLVSVPAIINLICLIYLTYIASCPMVAANYDMFYIKNSHEIIFFCLSLIGAILAFLKFNLKPAKIFMGDVGSLAIGASLGLIAIILKQELIFFIISILFVSETISVILQVSSYKIRNKRIFLMAPIHHHFEKLGWSEKKVVYVFWASSLFFAILGLSLIYV